MTDTNNLMPFNIVFLNEPLPKCFNQRPGMTYADLLSAVGREFKNPHFLNQYGKKGTHPKSQEEFRKEFFEEIRCMMNEEEYRRCLAIFHDLEKETDYQALKRSKYIGNSQNARNHMGANNLLEWVFSGNGRIDACFIQKDGVKFIFIMDVRLSNHDTKKDTPLHEQNRNIAKVISDSFDSKNGNDPDGIFKTGLLSYQHELLQNTNTFSAQFETLLVTIEQLVTSNESVQEKIDLFKRDFTSCLKHVDEEGFNKYIAERLQNGPIKRYQKELFEKLYQYEYGNDDLNNDIENAFTLIQLVKTTSPALFNRMIDLIEKKEDEKSESKWAQDILDCFRVFHKIPQSHIYILEEMVEDVCSDIEEEDVKNKLTYFVSSLKSLKEKYVATDKNSPLQIFKNNLQHVKKSRFSSLDETWNERIAESKSQNLLEDMLNIDVSTLDRVESIDKIAKAFIKMVVEDEYTSVSDFVKKNRVITHRSNKNNLYRKLKNPDDTFSFIFNELFKNEKIKEGVIQQYPYLSGYIQKFQTDLSFEYLDEINTICEYYAEYAVSGDEEFFIEANNVLLQMKPDERALLKGYVSHVFEQSDISELVVGSMDILHEYSEIEKLKEKEKNSERLELIAKKENEAAIRVANRVAFENAFNEFLLDMGNVDLYEEIQIKIKRLTQTDLMELKESNGELGEFISDYLKYRSQKKKPAFSSLIEKIVVREAKKRRMKFDQSLENYFNSLDRGAAKKDLGFACLTLEASDVPLLLEMWHRDEHKNRLKILFLETYQKASFDVAMKKIDSQIVSEKKEIYDRFEQSYEDVINDNQVSKASDFVDFLMNLTLVDMDMLLYMNEQHENMQAYQLLKSVEKIKSKNAKTTKDNIQTFVLDSARRAMLSKSMAEYFGFGCHKPSEEQKKAFIKALLTAEKSDINSFFSETSNVPPFNFFFGKLRNLKNKTNVKNIEENISILMESCLRRWNFYNSYLLLIRDDFVQKDKAEMLVDEYLLLTEQDQKDMILEQKDGLLYPVLLTRLNAVRKENNNKESLVEFIENNVWESMFYALFDKFPRENGEIKDFESRVIYEAAIASLSFDHAYEMLCQKTPKKPRCLTQSLKIKCFFDAYDNVLLDKTNADSQKRLKDICCMCTLPDLKFIAGQTPDDNMFDFVNRLIFVTSSTTSPLEKENNVHYAIETLISSGQKNEVINLGGFNMSLPVKTQGSKLRD
ncbi:MAG: hypothetical protein J6V53_03710 [Alphaproteobacteria bacterium]|nr:hypothetical protein [Alphaproteobacteria bacterium]